ncbi:MAG: PAS domain S-box protein [Crocinitomicaceae bacterium]
MDTDILLRKLEREKNARIEAERILEVKSLELYESNLQLQKLVENLEYEVVKRTAEIKESENNLLLLFEKHPFPMVLYDLDNWSIFGANETAIKKYGYSRGEFIQMKISDLHLEKDQPAFIEHLSTIKTGTYTAKEWQHKLKNNNIIDVQINGITIDYENRQARLIVIIDITDKKRVEKEKIINERKYKELVENVSDFIYRIEENGTFTYMNPTAINIIGFSEKEVVGNKFYDFIHPDYKEKMKSLFESQRDHKVPSSYIELPVVSKEGKVIWIGQTTDRHELPDGKSEFIATSRDITERKQIKDELQRSEEKYRNIMENMELGLLEVDVNGIITDAYPKFSDLSGYSKEELLGLDASKLLLPEKYAEKMRLEEAQRKGGTPGVYEVELRRKDGKYIWVIISGAPYYDQKGELAGTVGIHLNISERKEVEQKLEEAILTAEHSIKSKELFMANMSHEIRTPMNAIIGMSELLQKSDLEPKQKNYVEAISTSADNLLIIINDILDFSKIESGNLTLEKIPCNFNDLLNMAIKTIELKAEEKGISILTEIEENLSNHLADPTRFNQIIINLLSNAVKFTDSGNITLCCQTTSLNEKEDLISVSIEDTGIGIETEKLDLIFKSFIQAEESTARQYGGTGLGLAISKQLVELMGGELKAKSKIGQGSKFYFEFICSKTETKLQKNAVFASDTELVQGLNVLLVEDNDINRFMAITILEGWNCRIDIAVNGQEAVDILKSKTYDIILMDVRMPVLDGIGATKIIRADLQLTTPIIALTANAIKGDNEKCIEAGMNDYISKPFQQAELLALLIKYSNSKEPAASDKEISDLAENEILVDLTKLKLTTNGDKAFMSKMIQLFIDSAPSQLEEIEEAIEAKNWDQIGSYAHKIKPSIDYLGSETLQEMVREIEGKTGDDYTNLVTVFIAKVNRLVIELKDYL